MEREEAEKRAKRREQLRTASAKRRLAPPTDREREQNRLRQQKHRQKENMAEMRFNLDEEDF
jgi:hypothetical protein